MAASAVWGGTWRTVRSRRGNRFVVLTCQRVESECRPAKDSGNERIGNRKDSGDGCCSWEVQCSRGFATANEAVTAVGPPMPLISIYLRNMVIYRYHNRLNSLVTCLTSDAGPVQQSVSMSAPCSNTPGPIPSTVLDPAETCVRPLSGSEILTSFRKE